MKKKDSEPASATNSLGTAGTAQYEKTGFCSFCLMTLEAKQPGGYDPRHRGTGVPYGQCAQALNAKAEHEARINPKEATCTKCGCTDSLACPNGCWWLTVDRKAGTGVCSNCE